MDAPGERSHVPTPTEPELMCVMGTTKQNQEYTKMEPAPTEPADKASHVHHPASFAFPADLNAVCTDCGNRKR